MPIEHGDSWFSPKCIEVQPPREDGAGGRALFGFGASAVTTPRQTANASNGIVVRETAGAKLRRPKGNSPDHRLRSPSSAECARGSVRPNSQDVGLEAAIIERVRNSSLVEWTGTDNVSRLKQDTEAMDLSLVRKGEMVGERSVQRRSRTVRTGGAHRRANAGMSSVIAVRISDTECLRVPGQRWSTQGQSGPKPRTSGRRRWQAGTIFLHRTHSL
jgi:CRP-like cAMP-binding protein